MIFDCQLYSGLEWPRPSSLLYLRLVFLLINNLTNGLLHQFLATKTTEANKSLKTDANRLRILMSRKSRLYTDKNMLEDSS